MHSVFPYRVAWAGCFHWGKRPWSWSISGTGDALLQWNSWCKWHDEYQQGIWSTPTDFPTCCARIEHDRVFVAPAALQVIQGRFRGFFGGGLVNRLKVRHEGLLILWGHVLHRVPYLMLVQTPLLWMWRVDSPHPQHQTLLGYISITSNTSRLM